MTSPACVSLQELYGKSREDFRPLLRKAVFTGRAIFDAESALIDYLGASRGALGYVSRISPHDDVKSLSTSK